MAYIKTLKDNELIGGKDNTDVYPVTTTQAIFSQDNNGVARSKDGKPEKLEDRLNSLQSEIITETTAKAKMVDDKFTNITNELYDMVESLQVGGIALSNQFGNRTDIGITQKALTKAIGKIWDELSTITGKNYLTFNLTVSPAASYTEEPVTVEITADCSESISNFDSIKIYKDDVLVAESSDIEVFTTSITTDKTATIKAVGYILGKEVIKETQAIVQAPFFMGSGQNYTDVMTPECLKEIEGSLQGDYDVTVKNTNEYIFIIIPASRREEFRRAKLDMNGFEIPLTVSDIDSLIICKTLNTYQAGTYNIDIDINN